MATSRRSFIRQVVAFGPVAMTFWIEAPNLFAAAAGQCGIEDHTQDCTLPPITNATRFIPNEARVLLRYSAAEMSQPARAKELQNFRDAICMVRNLPPANLISWTKLVAQHCTGCNPANPNNVHYNWQFPAWHRCFLYFLERQLRIMSKIDGIRLIYWDWESASSRVLPAIYKQADQPLYWQNRYLGPNTFPLKDKEVDVQGLLALKNFSDFGGTAVQRKPVPALFSGPHAFVHNAFADPNPAGIQGDMADLQYSPRDPVFFAHHANIDRVWSSWSAISGHTNPDFGEAKAYFFDENQKWRFVMFNDLRDEKKLGYQYSSLIKPKVAASALHEFAATMKANHVTLAAPAIAAIKAPTADFLHIRNIKGLEKFPGAKRFGIFIGNPSVGTDTNTSPSVLGIVGTVFSSGHQHSAEMLSGAFEVTGRINAAITPVDLFVAPLDASEKTTAAGIPLDAEAITVIS